MPNHCYVTLAFRGKPDSVKEIEEFLRRDDKAVCFDNVIPQPPDLEDTTVNDSPMPSWYNWRVTNWGTKWEPWQIEGPVLYPDTLNDLVTMAYSFITAWSTPDGIFQALADRFPEVMVFMSYSEEFRQFSGHVVYYQNEEISELYCGFDVADAHSMMDYNYAFDYTAHMMEVDNNE
jgi:hypothetical protein